jgi:hypothetical protein
VRQFRRNGRALTDVGDAKILAWESCLETARRVLAADAPSRLDCVFACGTLVGAASFRACIANLRVHTFPVIAAHQLAPALPDFLARHPHITFVVVSISSAKTWLAGA